MLIPERFIRRFRADARRLEWVWRDTLRQARAAQIPLVASSLAYTTILSVVPMLSVSLAIFQAFGGLEKLSGVIRPLIIRYVAQGTTDEAMTMIESFIANVHAGALGAGGLVGLIITTMLMLSSAEKAINAVWQARITRTFFQRVSAYWLFITLGPLAASITLGIVSSTNLHLPGFLPGGTAGFAGMSVFFFLVYKWVPNRAVHLVPALAGALFTATLLTSARALYRLYTSEVLTYNKIYGSLAAVPIILVWIYISWMIVLTGAALSAAVQRKLDPK